VTRDRGLVIASVVATVIHYETDSWADCRLVTLDRGLVIASVVATVIHYETDSWADCRLVTLDRGLVIASVVATVIHYETVVGSGSGSFFGSCETGGNRDRATESVRGVSGHAAG
jgi:hypothetical protein